MQWFRRRKGNADQAVASSMSHTTQFDRANRLYDEGMKLIEQGNFKEALKRFESALALFSQLKDRRSEIATKRFLGVVLLNLGRAKEALKNYTEALEFIREQGDRKFEGTTIANIGLVYEQLGEKDKAREYFQEALEIAEEIGDSQLEFTAKHNRERL